MSRENGNPPRPASYKPKGVALVLVLLIVMILSTLAAAIIFTARAEALASYNFRSVTQGEYAAMAGVERALRFFTTPSVYTAVSQADAPTYYDVETYSTKMGNLYYATDSLVQCISGCANVGPVVLEDGNSNYPDSSTITEFESLMVEHAITAATNQTGRVTVKAELLEYRLVNDEFFPSIDIKPFEIWKITSTGWWDSHAGGGTTAEAKVVVEAIISPFYVPLYVNAMYGQCSVTLAGNTCTDSYNSASGQYTGTPSSCATAGSGSSNATATGSDVASIGGVTISGGTAQIGGNVTFGNASADAGCNTGFSGSTSTVTGEILPGPTLPTPPMPDMSTWGPGYPQPPPMSPSVPSGTSAGDDWRSDVFVAPTNPQKASAGCAGFGAFIRTLQFEGPPTFNINTFNTCVAGAGTAADPFILGDVISKTIPVNIVGPAAGNASTSPINIAMNSLDVTASLSSQLNITNVVPDPTVIDAAPAMTAPVSFTLNVAKTVSLKGQAITNVIAPGDPPPDSLVLNIHNMEDADPAFTLMGNAAISALINVNGNADIGGGGSSGALYGGIIADEINAFGGVAIHFDQAAKVLSGDMTSTRILSYHRPKY